MSIYFISSVLMVSSIHSHQTLKYEAKQKTVWSFLSLLFIIYGSRLNDFFQKRQARELMEKKREVLIGYENEF